jgi:hypothetical protein
MPGWAVVKETRLLQETWEHTPLSLLCKFGNIAVTYTIDNVKSVAP